MRDMKLFPVAMILHNLYLSKLRNVPVFYLNIQSNYLPYIREPPF